MKIINLKDFIVIGSGLTTLFFVCSFGLFYYMYSQPTITQPITDLYFGFIGTLGVSLAFGFKLGYDLQVPKSPQQSLESGSGKQ